MLERERAELEGRITKWNYKHWFKTGDREVVRTLGKYLKIVRTKITAAI